MSDARLHILSEPCGSCPFKGRMILAAGRLRDIVADCRRRDAYFTCHETIYPEDGEQREADAVFAPGVAVCAGWLEAARLGPFGPPRVVQVAERLDLVEWVAP